MIAGKDPQFVSDLVYQLKQGNPNQLDTIVSQTQGKVNVNAGVARDAVKGALATAYQSGALTKADIRQRANNLDDSINMAWKGVAADLQVDAPVSAFTTDTLKDIDDATNSLKNAQDAVNRDNAVLAEELSKYGAGFTDDQRVAFSKQFQAEHKDDYTAAAALAEKVKGVDFAALASASPAGQRSFFETYRALANTHQAQSALDFVSALKNVPGLRESLERNVGGALDVITQEIAPTAMRNVSAKILADHPDAPREFVASLHGALDETIDALSVLGVKDIKEYWSQLDAAGRGNLSVAEVTKLASKVGEEPGPLGAVVSLTLVAALANTASYAADGDTANALKNFAVSGQSALTILRDSTNLLSDAAKIW